jgi:hypothetical protein
VTPTADDLSRARPIWDYLRLGVPSARLNAFWSSAATTSGSPAVPLTYTVMG